MKQRKIIYISGTRADYGLMKKTLKEINKDPALSLRIIMTGMHLSKEFGYTGEEIKKDGFNTISIGIPSVKSITDMPKSFGEAVIKFSEAFNNIKPSIVLVEGDRYEALAATVSAAFLNIPIAHISGGDISGSIDESIRHAITKLAHIHFPGTKKSEERILKMGENKKNVFMVGTPGIGETDYSSEQEISRILNINLKKPIILVLQHPVTTEEKNAAKQIKETLKAVINTKYQIVIIYPNTDPGSNAMIQEIEKIRNKNNVKIYPNLPRAQFKGLMNVAKIMIGNSSAGLTETAQFNLPVINIGTRQAGRERGNNIYDSKCDAVQISKLIKKLINKKTKKIIESPYSCNKTPYQIKEVLKNIELNKNLIQKKMSY